MKIKLLDCTLRDGGYYNNWDFSKEFIDFYLKNISKLPFDYIEIGYVSNDQNDYYGQARYIDNEFFREMVYWVILFFTFSIAFPVTDQKKS